MLRLPYGDGWLEEEIPELDVATWLQPAETPPASASAAELLRAAFNAPLGTRPLRELVGREDRLAILVNDATRPCPTRQALDLVVEEFEAAGLDAGRAIIVVATGAHRGATQKELRAMLGEAHLARFEVVNHDARDSDSLVSLGATKEGAPLFINRRVAEATFRIAISTVAPHHSAGFSGGRKMVLPGVAGMESIRFYHSFPVQPERPAPGWLDGNPAHEVALNAARQVGVHFSVNVVPHPEGGGPLAVVAGELDAAHRAAASVSGAASRAVAPFLADLTVVSPGGYPRDINLHQAQKALSVAEMVTRPGGVIILVAECHAGIDGTFDRWLRAARSPAEVIERYRAEGWSESSAKAMMFARALLHHRVIVVTRGLAEEQLAELFLDHAGTLRAAVHRARSVLGAEPLKSIVIPRALGLIPTAP